MQLYYFVLSDINNRSAYQLVGHVPMILPCKLLTDSTLHQSRQRGQDVDGRVDLPVVKLTINENLSLGLMVHSKAMSGLFPTFAGPACMLLTMYPVKSGIG
jgi:hypothetical protein